MDAYVFMPNGKLLGSTAPRDQMELHADGSLKIATIASPKVQARPGLTGITNIGDFGSYVSSSVRAQKVRISTGDVILVIMGLLPGPLLYFFLKTYVWLASMQSQEERRTD